jgi:rSAM/selenodomain-associated transferase 2
MISIIIPTLNESAELKTTITHIHKNAHTTDYEIIIADGGSKDDTVSIAKKHYCKIIPSSKGRGLQLNNGAKHAKGDILLFLHADTLLPKDFDQYIDEQFKISPSKHAWGRFSVKLTGNHAFFRVIERMITLRSKVTGIATGDQAIFVKKDVFDIINGYENIPLMEDVEICKRLKKISFPVCLEQKVLTSSRRWEENGIIKTILLMWMLRLSFYIGISPNALVRLYK